MGKAFTVESFKDVQSFARWVCDVWLADGRNLADVLIAEGLGVAATQGRQRAPEGNEKLEQRSASCLHVHNP